MITCQYCGAKSPAGASFCDGCGAALTVSAASQAQASAQAQMAAAHAAHAQATAQHSAVHASVSFGTGRLPPQTLLRKQYLILKTIGRGGMAAVYQASDTRKNRVVAIKEMSQENLSPDDLREAMESFRREADLLQKLKHRNLPHVYEHFSENGRHYLVMDFIDGETLEQKLAAANAPLPEADVLGWARQLCDALAYLHQQQPPIIFRDLKPANVMVTKRGEVKLIDFGIARFFSSRRTRDTQALGTPGYAPPEQYGNTQTDPRADIYALGATLYHLLTNYDVGRTPFSLPPLRSRNPKVSAATAAAIERATRLDRAQRYPDVGAFARDLGVGAKPGAQPKAGAQAQQGAPNVNGQQGQWRARAAAGAGPAQPRAGANGAAGQLGQGGPLNAMVRAATAGIVAAGAAALKDQFNPQGRTQSPSDLLHIAVAAARSATGPGVIPVVQPREVDLGQLRAGQDGAATLTISGQNGAPVAGTLKALAPWLRLDQTQFSGVSSLIRVTARTSAISGSGPQQSNIEVAIGSQRMYVPVRLVVVPAPGAAAPPQPKPQPKPQAPPQPQPRPQPNPPRAGAAPAGAGRGAAQQAAYASPRRPNAFASAASAVRRSGSMGGVRLTLSLVLALALAFGLPQLVQAFAIPYLARVVASTFWQDWALVAVGALGALVGASLAYIGAAFSPGRLRTSILLGAVGAALAMAFTAQWQLTAALAARLPGSERLGALALTVPLLVSVGAAIGVQPLVSRGILAIARYVAARYSLVLVTAAIAGGWLGLTVAQAGLSAVFQQVPVALSLVSACGLIIGVALGLSLATPVGYLVRRFAFG